jgi:hypothetical protein
MESTEEAATRGRGLSDVGNLSPVHTSAALYTRAAAAPPQIKVAKLEEARARLGAQNAALQATIDGFQPTIAELTQARVKGELELAQLRAKVSVYEEAAAMSDAAAGGAGGQAVFSLQMRVASLEAQARAKDAVIGKLQQRVVDANHATAVAANAVATAYVDDDGDDGAAAAADGAGGRRGRKGKAAAAPAAATGAPPPPSSVLTGRGPVKMMQRAPGAAAPAAPPQAQPLAPAAASGKASVKGGKPAPAPAPQPVPAAAPAAASGGGKKKGKHKGPGAPVINPAPAAAGRGVLDYVDAPLTDGEDAARRGGRGGDYGDDTNGDDVEEDETFWKGKQRPAAAAASAAAPA